MYIRIKAHPDSKKEKIAKISEDHYEIWVKEPAERNMANSRILDLIRCEFKLAKRIQIINGHSSPSKLLSIDFE